MKTTNLLACVAVALGTSALSIADEPKPEGERPKARDGEQPKRPEGDRPAAREGEPAKRGEGDRPAAREGAPARRGEGERPAAREGERRPEGPGFRGFPGMETLTPEEREKLRAAQQKAAGDFQVKVAEAAMRDAVEALQNARDAALLAADPSLEPVIKKLKEAREKAVPEFRRRGEGDQPRRPEGVRDGDQPRRPGGAKDSDQPRKPEGARREPDPAK
jgi:hypothetical protein